MERELSRVLNVEEVELTLDSYSLVHATVVMVAVNFDARFAEAEAKYLTKREIQ